MKGYFLLLNAVAFVNWTEAQIVAEILYVCVYVWWELWTRREEDLKLWAEQRLGWETGELCRLDLRQFMWEMPRPAAAAASFFNWITKKLLELYKKIVDFFSIYIRKKNSSSLRRSEVIELSFIKRVGDSFQKESRTTQLQEEWCSRRRWGLQFMWLLYV